MRARIKFSKTEAMRFTGHLDLHRTWERTLRRSGLSLAYSQGFKPHARINLACALPLGFTSQGDIVDVQLDGEPTAREVASSLERAVPPGILIESVEIIDQNAPTLQSLLEAQEYVITFQEAIPQLDRRLEAVVEAKSLPSRRNNKDYDLRPLIIHIQRLSDDDSGQDRLLVRLSAKEGAMGRPEEVIRALGGVPETCRVHRTNLIFRDIAQAVATNP